MSSNRTEEVVTVLHALPLLMIASHPTVMAARLEGALFVEALARVVTSREIRCCAATAPESPSGPARQSSCG